MRLANEIKGREFLDKAKNWFKNTDSAIFFGDVKTIAIRAVAEYLANQEGLTLYNIPVKK